MGDALVSILPFGSLPVCLEGDTWWDKDYLAAQQPRSQLSISAPLCAKTNTKKPKTFLLPDAYKSVITKVTTSSRLGCGITPSALPTVFLSRT
jgi:hypothetical protein